MKEKYLNCSLLVVVATGTAFAAFIGDVSRGVEPLQTIFLGFVAVIIVFQVVPALILLGCMIKTLLAKPMKKVTAESSAKTGQ